MIPSLISWLLIMQRFARFAPPTAKKLIRKFINNALEPLKLAEKGFKILRIPRPTPIELTTAAE